MARLLQAALAAAAISQPMLYSAPACPESPPLPADRCHYDPEVSQWRCVVCEPTLDPLMKQFDSPVVLPPPYGGHEFVLRESGHVPVTKLKPAHNPIRAWASTTAA